MQCIASRNTVCEHYKFIEQVLIIKYQLGEHQPNELDVHLKLNVIVMCLCDVLISLTTCWCQTRNYTALSFAACGFIEYDFFLNFPRSFGHLMNC